MIAHDDHIELAIPEARLLIAVLRHAAHPRPNEDVHAVEVLAKQFEDAVTSALNRSREISTRDSIQEA